MSKKEKKYKNDLQNRMENRIVEAQIFELKANDRRINAKTRKHYEEVSKKAHEEATKLMNELMNWEE